MSMELKSENIAEKKNNFFFALSEIVKKTKKILIKYSQSHKNLFWRIIFFIESKNYNFEYIRT